MPNGFTGKMLEVDLTTRSHRLLDTDLEATRKFCGGRGLGAKILWDRIRNPGHDALSPETPLMFLVGPLNGAPMPGPSRFTVVTKSPHTSPASSQYQHASTVSWACCGGQLAPEIKFAGYDGIIIVGRADKPVYLLVDDDKVEIRDASGLWGKGTDQTDILLRKELGPEFRTAYIGPAGENLVEYAAIVSESSRAAGRTGVGCVMGSKKLKAIAVRGTKMAPIAKLDQFLEFRKKAMDRLKSWPAFEQWRRWGTTAMLIGSSDAGTHATRNHREGTNPDVYKIGAQMAERTFWVKHRACYHCPIRCMKLGVIHTGPFAGTIAEGPEYESGTMLGSNCLNNDLAGLMRTIAVADDLGLDNISTGNVLGFVMECYENGLLTKKDLDGIEATWGNVDAMLKLERKIAYREGIGDLLAKGVKKAAQAIGRGAEKFAMHVKGNEIAAWGIHANHGYAIVYGTSNRGACHQVGPNIKEQHLRTMCDSLVICRFVYYGLSGDVWLEALNLVTDWGFSEADYLTTAERIWNLERCFNVREGFRRADDYVPERFRKEPLTVGPKKGAVLPDDKQAELLDNYYKERGWDQTTGIPTQEKLKQLGLDDVAQEIAGLK